MMDCDTTGIEPDIALVKYKQLAGGGMLKIVNRTVPMALRKLGYDEPAIRGILDYIDAHDTIEGAPGLKDEHLPVFDCAFAPPQGGRSIHFRGHLQDDGRRAAVPLRGDLQDVQRARTRPPSTTSATPTSKAGSSASRRWPSTATARRGASR